MTTKRDWTVPLIGGISGTGKSIAAESIGRRLGIPWLQVDDLRLAFQRAQVVLPTAPTALYFFEQEGVWRRSPEALRDGLIAMGEILAPAIEAVVENHVDQMDAAVIEGDGIVPSLLVRPSVRERAAGGRVRSAFLIERDEEALRRSLRARNRGSSHLAVEEQRHVARANWLYGQWLSAEARRYGLPILEPRPWDTLTERMLQQAS